MRSRLEQSLAIRTRCGAAFAVALPFLALVLAVMAGAGLNRSAWTVGGSFLIAAIALAAASTLLSLRQFAVGIATAGRSPAECFRDNARANGPSAELRDAAHFERIGAILSGLAEPVIAVDGAGELVLANTSAERLFELVGGSASDQALESVLRCEKLVGLLDDTRRRKAPSAKTAEIEIADGDGRSRWFSATARTLLPGPAGQSGTAGPGAGAVAVLRDVSAQKAIQKRNAEFVSAVSHEMKTPLAGILAYVELLADGDAEDAATQAEFLSVINSQANRLQRLVDNLLNLARIESGVVSLNKQSRPLNGILEDAVRMMLPDAERKRLEVSTDLGTVGLSVLADRDMLLQAVINLISNAVKYTPDGGKIVVRSRQDDDEIRVEVEDTGVGLSDEDCLKVFDKFYRVQKDKQMAAGTGLGLPLARHIVEDLHGGKLTVTSQPSVGSTFTIVLPELDQTA